MYCKKENVRDYSLNTCFLKSISHFFINFSFKHNYFVLLYMYVFNIHVKLQKVKLGNMYVKLNIHVKQ